MSHWTKVMARQTTIISMIYIMGDHDDNDNLGIRIG